VKQLGKKACEGKGVQAPLQEAHKELEARVVQQTAEPKREIARRRKAEEALEKARDELERRVEERTAELKAANAQLKGEVEERRHAEESWRASEANYRAIFNAVNDAILVHDVETGDIVDVNWKMFEMYGFSPADLQKFNRDQVEGLNAQNAAEWFKKAAKGEGQLFEWKAKDNTGRQFWVEVNVRRALISGQHRLLAVVRDITDRKLSEEQLITYHDKLRAMASKLSLAEERERRRIAAEVHDHIGQNLAFAKIKLGTLLNSTSSAGARKAIDEVVKLVNEAIQDSRSLVSELGSPILYEIGFVPAVEWLTREMGKRHDITIAFDDDGQPKPLSDDIRVLLFQGVRELLANVVRHARADTAKVCVTKNGNEVRIDVEDDGIGFDPAEIGPDMDQNGRFGLFSIRERLEPLGGHVEVASEPGQGTKVTLMGPLKSDGQNERRKVS
jgi:PAS domain S-box-containing protein